MGPHPDDDRRRRWFLQDFAAKSLADERLELRQAAEIERMERALRSRQGITLDRFMYQCWECPAQDHLEASFQEPFGMPFMHPALRPALQDHSGSSGPELCDGASQPDDAGQRAEPMDDSEQEPVHAAGQPGEPARECADGTGCIVWSPVILEARMAARLRVPGQHPLTPQNWATSSRQQNMGNWQRGSCGDSWWPMRRPGWSALLGGTPAMSADVARFQRRLRLRIPSDRVRELLPQLHPLTRSTLRADFGLLQACLQRNMEQLRDVPAQAVLPRPNMLNLPALYVQHFMQQDVPRARARRLAEFMERRTQGFLLRGLPDSLRGRFWDRYRAIRPDP